jgi:hypothetical protein
MNNMKKRIDWYQREVDRNRSDIQKLKAEADVRMSQLKRADMANCYLLNRACADGEFRIPLAELAKFAGQYNLEWTMDNEKQEVVIKLLEPHK